MTDPIAIADRLELLALEGRYARHWDLGEAAEWAGLFAPDGLFEMLPANGVAEQFRGHEQLAAFCAATTAIYRGVHVLGIPAFEINADQASAFVPFDWIGIGVAGQTPHTQRRTAGYYIVAYRRSDDGGWRITRRAEHPISGQINETFGF